MSSLIPRNNSYDWEPHAWEFIATVFATTCYTLFLIVTQLNTPDNKIYNY